MDSTEPKLKVAVVGVGHLGQHHARIYTELPGVELVAVVDVAEGRRREVGGRLRVPAVADYRTLLGKVDAVSVAVPTRLHHEIARDFLLAGSDVLVEKPITRTLREADDLVAAAGDRILQVGHSERYNGGVQALATHVQEPGFIEVHRMGPFPGRGTDVDVVLDLMIHDIDIILTLVKSPVTAVSAVGVPVVSDQVDIANARVEFASGCVANLTASRVSGERLRKIRVFQRDTYFVLDYASQELHLFRTTSADGSGKSRLTRVDIPVARVEPLRQELSEFVHSVRTRRPPLVSGEAGREAVAVAAQIIERL
ncbi:MAG: UDP-N-acetyl-D-glucosamine dehydrogenase [candidate division NC10 bacterium RIFCSPLOWO2_12_FULL_66_18]|nr:MAG: UDP-N-acetyl-D-glucosamine dehydrogenase [candidate division NC10 bacterium RIFCSPLOWO2_02_FULL_66_22]OGC01761.1 MAG: UDP-N-acetyl-D-glucosamine dehydrogenase [candidate division NC10 bacterium RIFCSPLOWO2_12_FULL_66_18]